jgi:hypothetical protein
MLLNISITQYGIHKLNFKVGALKEAKADQKKPNAFNTWYLGGTGDPQDRWWPWVQCYQRHGWFDEPVYCSNGPQ